jgi:hypothetical protein
MNMAGVNVDGIVSTEYQFNERNPNDIYNDWNVRVYAVNYNVLRIMSGMGGLAYSN